MLQHIKSNLPDSELTHIEITFQNKNELHWKEANEFEYKGTMYDIVKMEKDNGHIVYHCIADQREMELLQQLEIQINKDKSTKNSKNNLAKNLLKVIPKVEHSVDDEIAKVHVPKNQISTATYTLYNSLKPELYIPPPKVI